MKVDRRDVVATLIGGQTERDLLDTIWQRRRDMIPGRQAHSAKTMSDLIDEIVEFPKADLVVVGIRDRESVAIFFGDLPKTSRTQAFHRCSFNPKA